MQQELYMCLCVCPAASDAIGASNREGCGHGEVFNKSYKCVRVFVCVQLQVMQQEPVTVKGLDMEKFFKSELRQAIKDLNDMYEERLEAMSSDLEAKYAAQVGVFVTFCCGVGWDGVGWCKMVWVV